MAENYYYAPIHTEILCEHKKAKGYQTYPYHRHNGYEIFLFLSGNVLLYIDNECYRMIPGDIIIIPPVSRHRIVSLDDQIYERIIINIKQSAAEKLSTSHTDLFACFYSCLKRKAHYRIWRSMTVHCSLTMQTSYRMLYPQRSMVQMLRRISFPARFFYLSTGTTILLLLLVGILCPPLVKNIMKYIQNNLAERLTLERLAKEFFLNGTYLSRLFKKHVGLSLREYILDQRIDFAKQLLSAGCSVSEACYTSGFYDYSNFIRSFTKIVGISPGKYKKKIKENPH